MTNVEYEAAMEACFDKRPVSRMTVNQLCQVANMCDKRYKELMNENRKAEASWFKSNRNRIRRALALAYITE